MPTSLSVVVPVYNEEFLVAESLGRLRVLEQSPHLDRIQVVVVDDCSQDGTSASLARFREEVNGTGTIEWVFLRHEVNQGKGKAVQTALGRADCEYTVIHDADLEYNPADLLRIVETFVEEEADAVFGSRFAGGGRRRVLMYRHELGNRLLTFLCNMVTNLNLTDMETCYKAVRTTLLKSIPLVSNDFRLEPELTIKLAKRQARIFEIPISYSGRTYQEGKKIGWRDGIAALWAILRFAVSDNVYKEDEFGSHALARLARAERFNAWMADTVRPYCGQEVLEIGSGVGNLTRRLIPRRRFVASDVNPLYLQTLSALSLHRPYLDIVRCDLSDPSTFPAGGGFDTIVCLNVLEHVEDDHAGLQNLWNALAPGGRAIVLVPNGPWNFGSLDEVVGHYRRYQRDQLAQVATGAGFEVERVFGFNRFGTIAWFLNGKILRRRTFGLLQVLSLNVLTPLFRVLEPVTPLPPLSWIGIFRRPA